MNKIKRLAVFLWTEKKTVNYLPWLCLPPIALLAALFFTYAQQSGSFPDALQNRRFLIAAAWSFLPAVIILFYVQALNYVLDLQFYRHGDQWKRIKKQLLYGVLVPGLFLASYYTLYYAAYGKSIFKRKYFQIEFPMAMMAIAGINVVYMLVYQYVENKREKARYKQSQLANHLEKIGLLTENVRQRKQLALLGQGLLEDGIYPEEILMHNGEQKILIKVEEIVCVMRWEKIGAIMLETGIVIQMDNTLDYMLNILDGEIFVKSNRWCIINLRHVTHTVYESENYNLIRYNREAKVLLETLKPQVDKMLEAHGKSGFLTTDKYKLSRNFRKNFEEKLEALRRAWV